MPLYSSKLTAGGMDAGGQVQQPHTKVGILALFPEMMMRLQLYEALYKYGLQAVLLPSVRSPDLMSHLLDYPMLQTMHSIQIMLKRSTYPSDYYQCLT